MNPEELKKKVDNLSVEFDKHTEKLNKKYQKVCEENKRSERLLDLISKIVPNIIFDGEKSEILFYIRVKNIFYLVNHKKNICLVCGKRRKTTAHHLIPIRAGCTNKILKQLRIRVCKECNEKIHPENNWIPQAIRDRDKKIAVLEEKIKTLENTNNTKEKEKEA